METWKNYKTNWIPRTAAVLLYLVLLSIWWLSGLSARFITGAAADDNARVAVFDVTDSTAGMSRSFAVVMEPGSNDKNDITVSVKNSSETAVSYTIAFLLDGNLPITVTPAETGSSGATTKSTPDNLKQESGEEPVWHTAAAMAGEETNYKFHLTWDKENNGYQFSEGIESITVEITAVQED